MAEFYFNTGLNAALATSSDDPDILAKIASHLTNLLMVRGDYEAALKAARPVVARLEELQCDTTSDYVNLLIYIGCCQQDSASRAAPQPTASTRPIRSTLTT